MIKIIGISGNMGSGKTTLAKSLAKYLQATIISWDDFDDISKGPENYIDWYNRGQNYKEWDYKDLSYTIESLLQGKTTIHPVLKHELTPTKYIIFDAPLGRLHEQTGRYIDICIHIEVPLDVSICRWLLRDFSTADKTKEDLLNEIEFYLKHSRPLFIDDELKQSSDLIINGMLPIQKEIEEIEIYLNSKSSQ